MEDRIISESVRFLGKTDKIQIEKDPIGLLDYIKPFLIKDFEEENLREFSINIRDKFVTRARERDRSLLFLNQIDEKFLYIIHLRQSEDLIDANFKSLIKPGFGKSMILRVFQFMQINDDYFLHFWEKYNSKILYNCFNIETENYDYSSLVKIKCKIENFHAILTLSPGKFEDLIKREKIKYDEKESELILNGIEISVNSLKVMGKSFKKNEFNKFKAEVLKFRDKILLDAEIKKKEFLDFKDSLSIFDEKIQLKLDLEKNDGMIIPKKKWKIIEEIKNIKVEVGGDENKFDKGEMENGLLIFLTNNKKHKLSDSLLNSLSIEIISRTYPGRIFFIFLDYAPHNYSLNIGNFEISNYSGLNEENLEEIRNLQYIFDKDDLKEKQRKLIVIAQLNILSKSPYYQLKYFSMDLIQRIKPKENICLKFQDLKISQNTVYVLDENSYERILEKSLNFGRELERTSSRILANTNEDTIRNYFLSMYSIFDEIGVTGETRNQYGKTDILLRHRRRNILVVECKKWYGEERFNNGTGIQPGVIDQLFSYLTRNENKALILLFINNKNFQEIIDQIPSLMKKHSKFKEIINFSNHELQSEDRIFLFNFNHPADNALDVKIAIIALHFPK